MSNDWSPRPDGDQNHPQNQSPSQDHLDHLRAQHQKLESYQTPGSGFPMWILWLGGLLLFNGLSYAFGWGFVIY